MSLTYNKYCIIETPVVDKRYIKTYNKQSANTFIYNGKCTVYYSDIVSPDDNKGCPKFNISDDISNPTEVGDISTTDKNKYVKIKNLSVYEISAYISKKYNDLIIDLQLVNTCNSFASNNNAIPSNCQNTFIGYTVNKNIDINVLPLYKINNSSKKELLQQINDLNNLINTFKMMIDLLKNTLPVDEYESIIQNYKQTLELRSNLDKKLGEIYKYNDSRIVQSQNYLDKTVYTNVLLTILATSLIYMVFIKL